MTTGLNIFISDSSGVFRGNKYYQPTQLTIVVRGCYSYATIPLRFLRHFIS